VRTPVGSRPLHDLRRRLGEFGHLTDLARSVAGKNLPRRRPSWRPWCGGTAT
jgi:hypothetical protein